MTWTLLLYPLVLFLALVLVRRLAQSRRERRLQETLRLLDRSLARSVADAAEWERARAAIDLRDRVGQLLTALRMHLSVAATKEALAIEGAQWRQLQQLADDSWRALRNASQQLLPPPPGSLSAAIRDFVVRHATYDLITEIHLDGIDGRLDHHDGVILYRVVQECVANAVRHSGARRLDLAVAGDAHEITATIEDDGCGFHPHLVSGTGLRHLRNRVAYLKGTVDIDSAPGRGTLVAIWIPLHEAG